MLNQRETMSLANGGRRGRAGRGEAGRPAASAGLRVGRTGRTSTRGTSGARLEAGWRGVGGEGEGKVSEEEVLKDHSGSNSASLWGVSVTALLALSRDLNEIPSQWPSRHL